MDQIFSNELYMTEVVYIGSGDGVWLATLANKKVILAFNSLIFKKFNFDSFNAHSSRVIDIEMVFLDFMFLYVFVLISPRCGRVFSR